MTLTYAILRFANFAHGELITTGAYAAWTTNALIAAAIGGAMPAIRPLSFSASVVVSGLVSMALTAALAIRIDRAAVSAPAGERHADRHRDGELWRLDGPAQHRRIPVLLEPLLFYPGPADRQPPAARHPGHTGPGGARSALTIAVLFAVHLFITRSQTGRAMRAVSENPLLSRVVGIDVEATIRWTWILGGSLAASAGTMTGVLVQIRPFMGFDLLLPLFAAAILGG